MPTQALVATPQDAGRRLDQFLAQHLPEISRARVQELIALGAVTLDGHPAKPSHRLRSGDTIHITAAPARPPLKAEPEDIPLDIVLDDPEFAVINKPAGMTVHAGAGDLSRSRGTLVNALLHRFQDLSIGSHPLRPGIVHRLDRETSGLVLVAKTDSAHRHLAAQFQRRQVQKTYLALVHGHIHPPTGTVRFPIARDPIHRKRMRALRDDTAISGRAAVTHYKLLESFSGPMGDFSLLEVTIETGRTHQIRVHLAALRHPVVGDTLYGPKKSATSLLQRNFLHAAELAFTHPRTGEAVRLVAPLPAELTDMLDRIRATAASKR